MNNNINIFEAVENNNFVEIREYFNNGGDIHKKDWEGDSLLHLASIKGQLNIVQYLILNGANCNLKNKNEKTPLHQAAAFGKDHVVEYLVANGAYANVKDKWGNTPIQLAVSWHWFNADAYRYGDNNEINDVVNRYINTIRILLHATNLYDYDLIYELKCSELNLEPEATRGIINKYMNERDMARYLAFCELFSIGTYSVEEDNNQQEANSLMIGYDTPLDKDVIRPFPLMFDSNLNESLFDATLAGESNIITLFII